VIAAEFCLGGLRDLRLGKFLAKKSMVGDRPRFGLTRAHSFSSVQSSSSPAANIATSTVRLSISRPSRILLAFLEQLAADQLRLEPAVEAKSRAGCSCGPSPWRRLSARSRDFHSCISSPSVT
jgi:hypothetical protein